MKTLLILLSLCVCLFGCDGVKKPVMDALDDTVVPPEEPTQAEIPAITFENAIDLAPGKYRVQPNDFSTSSNEFGEDVFSGIFWGNVSYGGKFVEREDFQPDAPKTFIGIIFKPKPYRNSVDGVPVIDYDPVTFEIFDEIVVEIISKRSEEEKTGGERGDTFKYNYIRYNGIAIENLTNPDRIFEYEE